MLIFKGKIQAAQQDVVKAGFGTLIFTRCDYRVTHESLFSTVVRQ